MLAGARIEMVTNDIDVNRDVRVRSTVIQLATVEDFSIGQQQTTQPAENVAKSLSPLINSMRLFGLYFTRESHADVDSASQLSWQSLERFQAWNPTRIYATIILLVTWINAFRFCVIFDGVDTLGVELLMKLGLISSEILIVVLFTAYYVGNHTGTLDRLFHEVYLSQADISLKYNRRAKVVTVICWSLVALSMFCYFFPSFINGQYYDETLLIFINTFHMPKPYSYIITAIFAVLQLENVASWVFPQAMNNIFYVGLNTVYFHYFFAVS